ncbi:ethanolamine ammonia-lyase subunit EutC [Limobrevibacterium gyesilva]|uniref:Ethanolamine ammonia-lyase small subunit n=1 Tax=Limobrevibacterium gyesilva TaxID=2991712 RepID=A0AA42CE46_9PROT|nr:ethanolamine ammonia-lyase subunit EutC [Limobrevibacterium gyesilva]MCW3473026.1 ethanolamine ammonia-lyase subunit EutC [Limobrevibacterium gyesilva]
MAETLALWRDLRRFTPARVALGRVGNGQPTAAHLAFQAAHAAARDAVHAELDLDALAEALAEAGLPSRCVRSACPDRHTYLLRPDLGRRLHDADRAALAAQPAPGTIAFVVCDGLSATAAQRHAAPLLARLLPALGPGPVVLARQGRVALGDDIGEAMGAEAVAVLIGERPGLSTPDSLGVYLTWQPRRGRSDAERNCISNIRPEGLPIANAAAKLTWLIREMRRLRLTGVALKDEQPMLPPGAAAQDRSISVVST